MIGYVFPGQASQFEGMGKELYATNQQAKELFDRANEILGFEITATMFEGTAEELKATKITQPAVFLHSVITAMSHPAMGKPEAVAGHSLGEFSAAVVANALSFEDGLRLVQQRANAMQEACEATEGTMAAVLGLEDQVVEDIVNNIEEVVVAANYNCPGQLVISGSIKGIEIAVTRLQAAGARRAIVLQVGGAFHSPLMAPAQEKLEAAIHNTNFKNPDCPIYQNVNASPSQEAELIKENLIQQLTSPVKWTQSMRRMMQDGVEKFVEVGGSGKTLQSFVKKIDRSFPTESIT